MAKVFQDSRRRKGGARPWIMSYTGLDGKRHRDITSATTKAQAEALLAQRLTEITKAKLLGLPEQAVKPVLFSDFLEKEYLPSCQLAKRPDTYSLYRSVYENARAFFEGRHLHGIVAADIKRYIDRRTRDVGRNGQLAPGTLNKILLVLSAFFKAAVTAGYIQKNPVHGIPLFTVDEHRDRVITPDEERKILGVLRPCFARLVEFALQTGLRRREIKTLTWSAVDLDQELVCIEQSKAHKVRYVPLNKKALEILKVAKDAAVPGQVLVFTQDGGYPFERISSTFRCAADAVGLHDVTFHTLRHTFASRIASAGVPLNTLRELLGHSDIKMVLRYAHLAPNCLRQAVDALDAARQAV